MRDKKGRFISESKATIHLTIPTLKDIFLWMLILVILFPWIAIGFRFNILGKIIETFENFIFKAKEEADSQKKNGLFY